MASTRRARRCRGRLARRPRRKGCKCSNSAGIRFINKDLSNFLPATGTHSGQRRQMDNEDRHVVHAAPHVRTSARSTNHARTHLRSTTHATPERDATPRMLHHACYTIVGDTILNAKYKPYKLTGQRPRRAGSGTKVTVYYWPHTSARSHQSSD
jgi:hypothetical protein